MADTPIPDDTPIVHLYVLLDRSGSMASMADDVIGGFNRLIADQQKEGPDALVTLVQFDSEDRHEVLADAVPVREMVPLDPSTFVPRGSTPLLDATALLLSRATARSERLASKELAAEELVVVSITDGHENSSREMTLAAVRRMIEARNAAGWTFVFLGAALDVYGEAGDLGYSPGSSQAWLADGEGAALAMASLSESTSKLRRKVRRREQIDRLEFFEGAKPAEADRELRG